MLRAMRRERSAESLRRLVARIRERVPGVAVRTSFIVGFPGETEEDFDELRRFVSELRFERLGVFRYSQEENTEAGAMPGQVDEETKEARWNRLMELQRAISREGNERVVGGILPVLVCGTDDEGRPFGRTRQQAPEIDGVVLLDCGLEPGEIVPTRIVAAGDYDLHGVPVSPVDTAGLRP
jgi:ribosomal protein S12 methylthiotransferase